MKKGTELLSRALLLFTILQMFPAAAAAGDPEFHLLVDRMSSYYQKRPMPFMGLLSFIGNRFTPHGVGHLQMAIFENVTQSPASRGEELESTLAGLIGEGYQPFVRVRENKSGESTFIYARESGSKHFDMLIVSIESDESVLIKLRLDPDAMHDWVDEPVRHGRASGHGVQ